MWLNSRNAYDLNLQASVAYTLAVPMSYVSVMALACGSLIASVRIADPNQQFTITSLMSQLTSVNFNQANGVSSNVIGVSAFSVVVTFIPATAFPTMQPTYNQADIYIPVEIYGLGGVTSGSITFDVTTTWRNFAYTTVLTGAAIHDFFITGFTQAAGTTVSYTLSVSNQDNLVCSFGSESSISFTLINSGLPSSITANQVKLYCFSVSQLEAVLDSMGSPNLPTRASMQLSLSTGGSYPSYWSLSVPGSTENILLRNELTARLSAALHLNSSWLSVIISPYPNGNSNWLQAEITVYPGSSDSRETSSLCRWSGSLQTFDVTLAATTVTVLSSNFVLSDYSYAHVARTWWLISLAAVITITVLLLGFLLLLIISARYLYPKSTPLSIFGAVVALPGAISQILFVVYLRAFSLQKRDISTSTCGGTTFISDSDNRPLAEVMFYISCICFVVAHLLNFLIAHCLARNQLNEPAPRSTTLEQLSPYKLWRQSLSQTHCSLLWFMFSCCGVQHMNMLRSQLSKSGSLSAPYSNSTMRGIVLGSLVSVVLLQLPFVVLAIMAGGWMARGWEAPIVAALVLSSLEFVISINFIAQWRRWNYRRALSKRCQGFVPGVICCCVDKPGFKRLRSACGVAVNVDTIDAEEALEVRLLENKIKQELHQELVKLQLQLDSPVTFESSTHDLSRDLINIFSVYRRARNSLVSEHLQAQATIGPDFKRKLEFHREQNAAAGILVRSPYILCNCSQFDFFFIY
jgi:energy-converting hydrogenase Eha subunit F